MGDWSAPGTGEAMGRDGASAVSTAHLLSLQQECLQLDRLKTQLSEAVQRYGGVQQVRLPRTACGPAGAPRALWFPRRLSHPWVGLGWPGGGPVLESRGWAGPVDGRPSPVAAGSGHVLEGDSPVGAAQGPLAAGESGHPRSDR